MRTTLLLLALAITTVATIFGPKQVERSMEPPPPEPITLSIIRYAPENFPMRLNCPVVCFGTTEEGVFVHSTPPDKILKVNERLRVEAVEILQTGKVKVRINDYTEDLPQGQVQYCSSTATTLTLAEFRSFADK